MDQKRRLDLERYRRMKEKSRLSPRVMTAFGCGPATPELEPYIEQKPKKVVLPYQVAPNSPDPTSLSRSMVCGIMGSQEKQRLEPSPISVSLHEQARQRRFNKFRSRSRDRYDPHPSKIDTLETSTVLISPSAAPTTTPPSGLHRPRASPLARLRKNENRRTPVDPPNGVEDPRATNNVGTFHEPIHLEDADVESIPPIPATTSAHHNSEMSGVDEPKPNSEPFMSSRSVGSSSTEKRDRIEESRDPQDYEPTMRGGMTPNLDRIETMRDAPPDYTVEQHGSLEMPSLHSRYSIETPQAGRRSVDVFSKTPTSQFNTGTQSQNEALRGQHEDNRQTLTNQFNEPLSIDPSYNRTAKQVQIYRPESPSFHRPALDQRTVRLLYSQEFQELIEQSKQEAEQDENALPMGPNNKRVSIVVRKRPISNEEASMGDFDVVSVGLGNPNSVVVYEATLQSDYKTKLLTPHSFRCDAAFSEQHSSEEFYIRAGQSQILTAKDGGSSAFVILGCPGSGKTYTMTDIEERAAYDIFGFDDAVTGAVPSVSVQYVELCGKQCFDLIGSVGNFVRVVESDSGYFQFKGAMSKAASNAKEMLIILSDAKRRLATQASIRRRTEGQIFVVCKLTIRNGARQGSLTLVECSTSQDSSHQGHAPKTLDTGSFDHLMQCLNSKASGNSGGTISGLSSNVSKILKETLDHANSRVCVVATVPPNASGTESTLATLSTLSKLGSSSEGDAGDAAADAQCVSPINEAEDLTLPRQWSHAELVNWMGKKNLLSNPVPPDINGRFAMRMSKMQLKNTFYDVLEDTKAEKLYAALRAENDRIARIRVKRRIARDLNH